MITPQFADQLEYVFPRVVFALRLRFQQRSSSSTRKRSSDPTWTPSDCSVQQWQNGAKVVRGPLSAVVSLLAADDGRKKCQLAVTCRGPADQRRQLFFLQVLNGCRHWGRIATFRQEGGGHFPPCF